MSGGFVSEAGPSTPDVRQFAGGMLNDADRRDFAATLAVAQHRRQVREDRQNARPLLPYPVYVAEMADGRMVRMSFFSAAGKPLNYARGYNACLVVGRERPIAGWVECDGQRLEDPFWSGAAIGKVKMKRVTPADRLAALVDAVRAGNWQRANELAQAAA